MLLRRRLRSLALALLGLAACCQLAAPAQAQSAGWVFPAASSYTAASGDNGKILSSENAPGASITVTLPSPASVGAGWEMGFSEANGRGIIVNAPGGVYIDAGQKQLTSLSAPSDTNFEYFAISSDGTNFRLLAVTKATALAAGIVPAGPGQWTYLFSLGLSVGPEMNGAVLTDQLAGGNVDLTLPSTPLVPNGWSVSLYAISGNAITLHLNGVSGGSLIDPSGTSVTTYTLSSPSFATLSFDGAAFRVIAGGGPKQTVWTNAQLAALTAPASGMVEVERCGIRAAGDVPCQDFLLTASACTIGGGDTGTQVVLTAGGCALAVLPDVLDIRQFGSVGDGTTDDTASFNAGSAASFNLGRAFRLTGQQFAVTAAKVYAKSKTIWSPGACLVQRADGNATLATLPSPGATPGPAPDIVLDHACVHVGGHQSAAILAEQATSVRMVSPQWDGLATTACTFTHDDGVNHTGTYPCGGILLKGITGVTGLSGNLGPYYWHISDAESRMPFGTVTVSGVGTNSFTFTGTTCSSNCSNSSVPPTIAIGDAVGDLTKPGGQIPAGTTITNVTAQTNGTVTLSGPHTIQIGDLIQFTTTANPAIWTGTTAGQTNTRPNFGKLDGRSRFVGYNLAIWNCAGSDNSYDAVDWSESSIGFENGGCGIDVQRTTITHPEQEDVPVYGIWNTADANQGGIYDQGLRIVDGFGSQGGTFVPLFDQGQRTSAPSTMPAPRPNLLANGSFEFDQANGNNTLTLASGVTSKGPDAWEAAFANVASGAFTAQRLKEGPNPGYRFWRLSNANPGTVAAGSVLAMWNVATGDEIADANFGGRGQSICQSFLAESSLSGTFAAYVMNAAGTRAYAWPFTLTGGAAPQRVSNCFRPDTPDAFSITASISGTVMTVTMLGDPTDNQILPGDGISGAGVTAGTVVVAQLLGTPYGLGTYTVSPSQTVGSEAGIVISSPWMANGPQRSLLAGVTAAAGTANQIAPGQWTTIPQLTQGVGVSGQSTDMLTTNGATLDISEMKLELGDQPTDYLHEPYAVALRRVRSRYWKTFPVSSVPANFFGVTGARCQKAASATAGAWSVTVGPDQPMLANPAVVTTYNPLANNSHIRDVTAGSDAIEDIDPSTAIGDQGVEIAEKTTTLTVGDNYCVHVTIDRRP